MAISHELQQLADNGAAAALPAAAPSSAEEAAVSCSRVVHSPRVLRVVHLHHEGVACPMWIGAANFFLIHKGLLPGRTGMSMRGHNSHNQ
jgi:hypothetical protein